MLGKHIIGYMPSLVIPAMTSFAAIFCYTRLLSPHDYGYYALAFSIMNLLNAVFFYWLQTALPQLLPAAIKQGNVLQLRVTAYIVFVGLCVVLLAVAALAIGILPPEGLKPVAWLAVGLAVARSLLNLNQAFHRSRLDFRRYNIVECGQALLGLTLGLILVCCMQAGSSGAIAGMIAGMACMVLVDARALMTISLRYFSRAALQDIARFGLPLVLSYGFAFIISSSDRFMIEHFQGAAEVGIYAAGYSLMDRIGQILFMVVATPSFPLIMHKLEHEGVEAAREQTRANGVALLALALPACAGLMMCNRQLAVVLIGSDFREGAMEVMPWIAFATLLNGLSAHYFDHAFYLAKKPCMLIWTQGPAALCNVALNLLLIPRMGYMAAAYSTVVSYAVLLTLSIILGRRVFRIRFPFLAALQVIIASAMMALTLQLIPLPDSLIGLVCKIIIGGSVYLAFILACNLMDIRRKLLRFSR